MHFLLLATCIWNLVVVLILILWYIPDKIQQKPSQKLSKQLLIVLITGL